MSIFNRFVGLLDKYCSVNQDHQRDVMSLFEPNPEAKLLDLGCGNGGVTLKIAQKIGTNQIFGIDVIDENVDQSRAKGIDCYQANLDKASLPFEDESFDIICANQVLEHLSDTDTLLKEIHRLLKPSGYAIISTPNLAASHNIFFLLLGLQPPQTAVSDEFDLIMTSRQLKQRKDPWPTHRRAFTLEGLTALLQWHGFIVGKVKGSGLYPLPATVARFILRINKWYAAYIAIKARKVSRN